MYTYFDYSFEKEILILNPGEYYATADNRFLGTVLGSCVAVVLYDPRLRIGGMNHFLLPGQGGKASGELQSAAGKYGNDAMRLLLQSMQRLASSPAALKGYIFGGGNVLSPEERQASLTPDIGTKNIAYARSWLHEAGIAITGEDCGEYTARKILFSPVSGALYLKHLSQQHISNMYHPPNPSSETAKTGKERYKNFVTFEPGE